MQRSRRANGTDKTSMQGIRIEFRLPNVFVQAALALVLLIACSLLVVEIVSHFTVSMLTDERGTVAPDVLASASLSYPSSSRLQARLAQLSEQESNLAEAQDHALQAVELSPYNYNYRLLLASIEEELGDSNAAEQSLRAGLALAPNKTEVHWQLANLLLRRGYSDQATPEFLAACALNTKLFPTTLNLVWRSSGSSVEALEAVTTDQPDERARLALFLLKHDNVKDASRIFGQLGPTAGMAPAPAKEFLDGLISAGEFGLARGLWIDAIGEASTESRLMWNGSFESDISKDFGQFNWLTSNSDYAKVRIAAGTARTGSRSLKIDFTGKDTTRLDSEVKQLVVVRPNVRYTLECYAKAERLVTPEGPRLVVTFPGSKDWIAASDPVAADQQGWQHLALHFTAPATSNGEPVGLLISIKRRPKFSYDEPTKGIIFFDDFMLTEEEPRQINAQLSLVKSLQVIQK